MLLYEDPELQQRTREFIPLAELRKRAKEASDRTKEGGGSGVDERDCLILELLSWFKGINTWHRFHGLVQSNLLLGSRFKGSSTLGVCSREG